MSDADTLERKVAQPATGAVLLAFADADGVPRRWRLVTGGAIIGRGDELAELPEQRPWVKTVLAVPGADVAIHWLELAESLTPVQAAAAARLQLADDVPEPLERMHVVSGRQEDGRTAIAVVPLERMEGWIAAARTMAIDPDLIVPAPMLLMPPGEGLVRYDTGDESADYRGTGQAFALEDELAALVIGDAPVREIGDDVREAGFAPAMATSALNLRQGVFARKRERAVLDRRRINWMITLCIILLIASLLIEINAVVRQTLAADQIEAEARELAAATGGPQAAPRGGFGAAAGALFESIRDTPAASVTQIVYSADGSLRAAIIADSQATIDGIRARIEGRGMTATGGVPSDLGGRASSEITVRPR